MIKIGFIGTEDDIKLRLGMLKKTFGNNNIYVLKRQKPIENLHYTDTVENLIDSTDVIFYGREAISNQTLLYHTLKEANKVFLDNDYFLPTNLLGKCKAYHEEAGNQIAFNAAPFFYIYAQISKKIERPRHVHYQSVGNYSDILKKTYDLVVLGCSFLGYSNLRSSFHILPQNEGKPISVSISIYNLDGDYYHLSVSSSNNESERFIAVNEKGAIDQAVEPGGIYSSADILKKQIYTLYNGSDFGNLGLALAISKIMERLIEIVNKNLFLSLNE